MADAKISELTLGTPTDTDIIPFVDLNTGVTKKAVKTDLKGPAGADGADGTDGVSFTWKGAYSAETTYAVNDAVSYSGSSYMCKLESTGNLPTNTTYWDLMAQKGSDGAGSGDVIGPATNTDSYIPQWDGANSKTLKNGLAVPTGGLAGLTSPSFTTPNLGTPSAGTLTNCSGLPVSGITASTSTALGVGSIELGHASDTTIARVSAGVASIEGKNIALNGTGETLTTGTIELGAASDTTIARASAGVVSIEGNNILTSATGLALSGGTMTGDIQLGETLIKLDATLSEDAKWSGISTSGTLGATIAVGDLCYLNADDSRWELVDANLSDGYDKQLGISLTAGNDGDACNMLVFGKVRSAVFPAFTVGSPLYMSETAGDVTHTQPTTADVCIRIVGFALTAEDLFFNPSNDYIVHS